MLSTKMSFARCDEFLMTRYVTYTQHNPIIECSFIAVPVNSFILNQIKFSKNNGNQMLKHYHMLDKIIDKTMLYIVKVQTYP